MASSFKFKVAWIQHCAVDDLSRNLATLTKLIGRAATGGGDLIALPEACDYLTGTEGGMQAYAQPARAHDALSAISGLAVTHAVWILVGSLTMKDDDGAAVNRSLLLDPLGAVRAHYDKIHMFDAVVPGVKASTESRIYRPGDLAVTAELPWCRLGFSICYDLRFSQLYRRLAQGGATVLAVPAAFTGPTGEAHWHLLLRSRAIENGCSSLRRRSSEITTRIATATALP
ncbi:MAG TPA: nitrilase-related carbon-nitrogen hydrolase [Woeseiaceae bacterium]|nr:nitrilase-related carbon-nitrogen hydrolase [Woeseiaceae bacterium]